MTTSLSNNTLTNQASMTKSTNSSTATGVASQSSSGISPVSTAPVLKVMRVQRPSLASVASTSSYQCSVASSSLSNVLLLPDSFGTIHMGEAFTACLSVTHAITPVNRLPTPHTMPIIPSTTSTANPVLTNLTVTTMLQTPTQRHHLPNPHDTYHNRTGHTLPLHGSLDLFVSRIVEEEGQHILRVEVSYCDDEEKLSDLNYSDNYNSTPVSANSTSTLPSSPISSRLKVMRKFYRFMVTNPFQFRHSVVRNGDACCFLSLEVMNALKVETEMTASSSTDPASSNNNLSAVSTVTTNAVAAATAATDSNNKNRFEATLAIASVSFIPSEGLAAEHISTENTTNSDEDIIHENKVSTIGNMLLLHNGHFPPSRRAVELYDACARLGPGESMRYLFAIRAASKHSTIRGIAFGDELGKVLVTWHRTMGEKGQITSPSIYCPPSIPSSLLARLGNSTNNYSGGDGSYSLSNLDPSSRDFVVHGSGLSVDTAAAAAAAVATTEPDTNATLAQVLPITVEPIDPPHKMMLGIPHPIELLIVNHCNSTMNLQLQMRSPLMKGVVVCGPSFKNIGEIPPNGGSTAVCVHLLAMAPGLFRVEGCYIVEPTTGREFAQPALFSVFVESSGISDDVSISVIDKS